ncbi:nitrate regulatory gene2 protein-like [Cucurbita moschata]|uniref:Nitrate regulatory gene2 protein-like n=1 Tax=Cucurbita moschata TaxID=3662 RepID=A0A6J1GQ84_CUCMO|nr:nitrate regulatory gene2 protein-like [Cucurbita moschata]XP_022954123.1 nitrate regulatory gene2 protein-like [Cucurbita moschata]
MGCSQSKIENEEVVSRCKDRKMFMKEAVAARNAFAAAHSSYAMSLKNTGAVLSDYAHGEVPPAASSLPGVAVAQSAAVAASASYNSLPPPPPPLPGSPGMPLRNGTSMFEIKASKVEPKRVETVIEEVDENDFEIECSVGPLRRRSNREGGGRGGRTGLGELAEEENGPPPPLPPSLNRPPPPNENRRAHSPSPQDATYDYLFSVENMPAPTLSSVEDFGTNTEAIERRAAVEKSGGELPSSSAGKTSKKLKQVGFPCSIEGKRAVKGNTSLLQIFMELDDHFLKASESAHDVSKMLEATRLHFHSNFADNRGHIDHSARVMRVITWNRSFRGLPNNDDLNDDFDTEEHETHATVLDKLLAWEKKLFEEVKAGEVMKFEYQKKVAALNKLKKKGSNFEAIEKAKATVSHLHTRYIVDMQSMDSTVSEINRIRDEQLYPKLVQLVNGMASMWEIMHFHHGGQLKAVAALRTLDIPQSPKETSDHHHERTVQLWAVVQEWHSQLEKLVTRQKEYIKALSNWLRLNLIPTESSLKEKVSSPPRVRSPPIQSLLHVWQDHLEKLPDEVLRNAIFTFATVINTIVQSQEEEMKLKVKCQETEKELARKSKQFKDWQKKYVQRRAPNADEANQEETGDKDAIAERQAAVEAVEKRLEEEREEHQKLCLHVREKSLGSLKNQLPELFRALFEFSLACSRMYRHLKSISQPLPNRPQSQTTARVGT